MQLRWILSTTLALAATLSIAGAALAGGSASVTLDSEPGDPVAGEPMQIGFVLLQHGRTPVSWPSAFITATNAETGETVRAEATADGAAGHYIATLALPSEGTWNWAVETDDLAVLTRLETLTVSAPTAASSAGQQAPILLIGVTAVVAIAVTAGATGVLRRARPDRDGRGDEPLPVRA